MITYIKLTLLYPFVMPYFNFFFKQFGILILVFKIFYGVFGEGTRLAMSKTICASDTSSLKPGSGATEGVLY